MSGTMFVALLRGINVSGHHPVSMKDLRTLVEAAGGEGVETYVQSGNVVFRSTTSDPHRLRGALETRIRSQLGHDVVVVLRSAEDLRRVTTTNPLLSVNRDRAHLHVTFLAAPPDSERLAATRALAETHAPDIFRVGEREVYLYCPNGYGRTKLNNAFFERKLAVAATTRNWRTVTTLAEMTHS